jgi:hypothetical protein
MTTYDDYPVRPEIGIQTFDGKLEEYEVRSRIDTDRIIVHLLEAKLAKNDRILIPSIQSINPYLGQVSLEVSPGVGWEAPIMASVTIGLKPTANNLVLAPLAEAPVGVKDYYAARHELDASDLGWLLLARETPEEGMGAILGDGIIKRSRPNTTIGRAGNLKWRNFGVSEARWNPFRDNPDFADEELRLTALANPTQDIAITCLSSSRDVRVITRATQEHLDVIGTY